MGTIGAAGATPADDVSDTLESTGDHASVDADVQTEQASLDAESDVEIASGLEGASGETTLVVRLNDPDLDRFASHDAAQSALRSHAEATQGPVVEWAESSDALSVENTLWITNAVVVTADLDRVGLEEMREELSQFRQVERVHPNYEYSLPGPAESTEEVSPSNGDLTYGLDHINVTEVWDDHTRGEDAEIAVLDTGVDPDHPDIDIAPENFEEFDANGNPVGSDPHDSSDHGTHVSGTVSASEPDDELTYGVAPDVELHHGLVIPGGGGDFAQIAGGIEWAVDQGVDASSMSLGASGHLADLIPAVENSRDAGTMVIAAVGNQGLFDPPPPGISGSPGNYWSTMGVGATNANFNVASFSLGENIDTASAWGSDAPDYWPDEYTTPAVSAPGVDVLSAAPGGGYQQLSGTSMATPHVAGVYALMVSAHGENNPELFSDVLENTAWKPDDASEPAGERDNRYGSGIVDAAAAVEAVAAGVPEYDLGDVNEDGKVGVSDVVKTQQHLAGIPVDNFNANLADVDRSGTADNPDVDVGDLITIQRKVLGMTDPGQAMIEDVSVDEDTVELGDTFNVTVETNNPSEEGAIENVTVTFDGADDPSGEGIVDVGPGQDTDTVEVTADGAAGEDVGFTVATDSDDATGTMTVNGDFFEVTEFSADETVDELEGLNVSATVENTGTTTGIQDVAYVFDGETHELDEDVELGPGETHELNATVDVTDVAGGTYDHGVQTDTDEHVASVEVLASSFDVTITDSPSAVEPGEDASVNVTVENTGNGTAQQEIGYEVAPADMDHGAATFEASETLTLEPDESENLTLTHTVSEDLDLSLDHQHRVTSDDDVAEQDVEIQYPTGSVEGTVTSAEREEPVEGVSVTLEAADGTRNVETGADGAFAFDDVAAGNATLSFAADGFESGESTVTIEENATATPDATLEELEATIGGTITASDDGEPVTDATIEATNDLGHTFTAATDEDGEYTFDGLYSGDYHVEVVDAGDGFESTRTVEVEPGEDVTGVDFEVDPVAGTIEGVLETPQGDPVPDATVFDADGAFEATTNETGEFEITGVDRGTYALRASHDGYGDDTGLYFVDVEAGDVTTVEMTMGTHFAVSELEAPDEAAPGDTITVNATVTNTGDHIDERTVFYYPPGTTCETPEASVLSTNETVELEGGDSTTVAFEHTIAAGTDAGEYQHCVSADEIATGTINVTEPALDSVEFEINDSTDDVNLTANETVDYTATAHYADGTTEDVTTAVDNVSNDDEAVATVDTDAGTVTAEENGTATISVEYDGESSNAVTVDVAPEGGGSTAFVGAPVAPA